MLALWHAGTVTLAAAPLITREEPELGVGIADRVVSAYDPVVTVVALALGGAACLLAWHYRRKAKRFARARAAAESASNESNAYFERLRQAVDRHGLVSETDAAGRITEANEAFCQVHGYARDEIVGQTHRIFASGQHGPAFFGDLWNTVRAGRIWRGEICNRRKDGSLCWLDTTIVPFLGSDGRPARYMSLRRDVSGRKQVEKELERLSLVASRSTTGIFVTDARGCVEWINEGFSRITGFAAAEMQGRDPSQVLNGPGTSHATVQSIGDAIRAGVSCDAEVLYYHKRGRPVWMHLRLDPVVDSADRITNFVGVGTDITEARNLRERLEAAHDLLVRTQQIAGLASFEIDLRSGTVAATSMFYQLLEIEPSTPVTRELATSLVDPGHQAELEQAVVRAVNHQEPWDLEVRVTSGKGRSFWVCTHGTPICEHGATVRVAATIQDIDDFHRLASVLEDTNHQLESAIERANQLAQDAMIATEAKSLFLASMSHEIRTPLNGVIGFAGLLENSQLDEEQRDYARQIRHCGENLLGLVNDVLDFSKIESGRIDLEQAPFNVREAIESSVEMVAPRAASKNLDVVTEIDPSVPDFVIGDATRVRQVVLNLLGNAVKFTSSGEIHLRVEAALDAGTGRCRIDVSVRDTGIGISSEAGQRLFQPFSQEDASTTRRFGGSGLGLVISKRLVELMHGEIGFESTRGEGSTFWFNIHVGVVDHASSGSAEGASRDAGLGALRVLLVDDNATVCRVVAGEMARWGLSCATADSGLAALVLMRQSERFDLVLVDRCMPEMDGIALAREMAQLGDQAPRRMLLLSSLGEDLPPEGRELFAGAVHKPIRMSTLRSMLENPARAPRNRENLPQGASPGGGSGDGRIRVLVAEDNPVNLRLVCLMLKRLGVSADVARDGREALERVRAKDYDLVLMDVQMPEMDGIEATRVIRAELPGDRQPRIIAFTANAMCGDAERCRAAGMDGYLAKPVQPEKLAAAVDEAARKASRTGRIDQDAVIEPPCAAVAEDGASIQ